MSEANLLLLLLLIASFALLSGPITRGNFTPPMVFTGFGLLLSPLVLGWIELDMDHGWFRTLAEITLILVLFTDAARIKLKALWSEHDLPLRLLLIGMPLTILLGTLLAQWLLPQLLLIEAIILAIILAPTDAALGQAVVSSDRVPGRIRQSLNIESGLNDGIAFPALLFALSFVMVGYGEGEQEADWLSFVAMQLLLGPLAGIAVGWLGALAINRAIEHRLLSHEFCNIYLLTLGFIAYLLASEIGGNGFIAAFVAGIATGNTLRHVNDEIYEFAESEGQLLNLVLFFLFGVMLLPEVLPRVDLLMLIYALLSLTLIRILPVALALLGMRLRVETQLFLGWFGPRGLASILFVLLALEHGELSNGSLLFDTVMLTVALSILLHGLSALPGVSLYARALEACSARGDNLSAEHSEVTPMPLRLSVQPGGDGENPD